MDSTGAKAERTERERRAETQASPETPSGK